MFNHDLSQYALYIVHLFMVGLGMGLGTLARAAEKPL